MKPSDDRGRESAAPLSLVIIVSAVCATQQGREGKERAPIDSGRRDRVRVSSNQK